MVSVCSRRLRKRPSGRVGRRHGPVCGLLLCMNGLNRCRLSRGYSRRCAKANELAAPIAYRSPTDPKDERKRLADRPTAGSGSLARAGKDWHEHRPKLVTQAAVAGQPHRRPGPSASPLIWIKQPPPGLPILKSGPAGRARLRWPPVAVAKCRRFRAPVAARHASCTSRCCRALHGTRGRRSGQSRLD